MAHPRRTRALSALAFALVTPALVAGCGGGGDDAKKPASKTPTQVMATAKKKFDDASSVHIALSTTSVPPAGNGVLDATGDINHDPAFQGNVKAMISGVTATVPVTSVGGKVYIKMPFQTKYTLQNPDDFGAPDPADFADPDNGLSSMFTKLKGLEKGAKKRSGSTILTSYTGTLPGTDVKRIIPSAVTKETYATTVGVDDKGYARTVKVTGPFFTGKGDVTYDVKFDSYGQGAKITAPTG